MSNALRRGLVLCAISMTMMLAGCKTSDRAGPAPEKPAVQIPRDCEDLLGDPKMPAVKKEDARIALAKTRVALAGVIDANQDSRECQAAQRDRFARGGR